MEIGNIRVFWYITNYHKLSGWKKHSFVISQFWSEVHGVTGFSAQDSVRLTCSPLELKVLFWAHSCWLAEFDSLQSWDWGPVSLLTVGQKLLPATCGWSRSSFCMWLLCLQSQQWHVESFCALTPSDETLADSCSGAGAVGNLLLKGSWD